MLDYLRAQSLALLDDVTVEFHPQMNVLTGETGAGKSLIIDALSLLRGGRAHADLVREGADAARVEAQFALEGSVAENVRLALAEHGIEPGADEGLVVERVVSRQGRGRGRIQARLTTQAVLRLVGEQLVDICSQHEHHSLAHVGRHLELLDAYAGLDAEVAEYAQAYSLWREARRGLEDLRQRGAERLQRMDYLRFQIDEIKRVEPQEGEHEQLRGRASLLRNAHAWISFARETSDALYESDDAIAGRLAGLLDRASRGSQDSPLLAEIGGQLENAQIACEEAAAAASRLAQEFDVDPDDLAATEERLSELERLRRKHDCEVDALSQRCDAMETALAELENAEERQAELEEHEAEQERSCQEKAERLHGRRVEASASFAEAVEARLTALHIPDAKVSADVTSLPDGELAPRGADRVEFLFSGNAGEPLAPLTRVASGGELSRVLLALKGVLSTGDRVATYVFDEVDAGVGGAAAEAIGRELAKAAVNRQVLCVTHLPQIAAFAQAHYRVEKGTEGGRTRTRVVRLDDAERVEELARMLAGTRVTAQAREHAAELLRQARRQVRGRTRGAKSGPRRAPARTPHA